MTDSKRIQFYKSLTHLRIAAGDGYPALRALCFESITKYTTSYVLSSLADKRVLQLLKQDDISKVLMPQDKDLPQSGLIPLFCSGDGNCLFRYDNNYIYYFIINDIW